MKQLCVFLLSIFSASVNANMIYLQCLPEGEDIIAESARWVYVDYEKERLCLVGEKPSYLGRKGVCVHGEFSDSTIKGRYIDENYLLSYLELNRSSLDFTYQMAPSSSYRTGVVKNALQCKVATDDRKVWLKLLKQQRKDSIKFYEESRKKKKEAIKKAKLKKEGNKI
jgi:hypothetical protein